MKSMLTQYVAWLLCLLLARPALAQNLAYQKAALASSTVQAAANAFDGNGTTRWESKSTDNEYIIVDLGSVQTIDRIRLTWENAYGKNFTLDVSGVTAGPSNTTWDNVVGGSWTTLQNVTNNTSTNNEYSNLGSSGRYVRMKGITRATGYGYSLYEFEVFSYSNSAASNLATSKPGYASTTQGGFPAAQAFDNDNSTRWGSSYADNQWLYVDLRGYASITRVYLVWEVAYGKDFRIEVSNDASTWTTVSTITGNTLRYNEIAFSPAVSGRYVRMYGVTRGTGYGFSLYEFQVYGSLVTPLPVSLVSFAAQRQAGAVALTWRTASEQNSQHYEVQRSADGADFATLGLVAGAGTSSSARSYQYLDAAPLATPAYYRLRQVDLDGRSTYSPTVVVAGAASSVAGLSVYPNPAAGGQATVVWQASAAHSGRWMLRNGLGQVVHTQALQGEAGPNALPLDLAPYAAGSYWLTLEAAGQAPQRIRLQINQ